MNDSMSHNILTVAYLVYMSQQPLSSMIKSRLLPGMALLWGSQLGLAIWFLVGQGYDRTSAEIVPVIGLGMLPLTALAYSYNMAFCNFVEQVVGKKPSRLALLPAMMVLFLLFFALCIVGPALIVLKLIQPPGPFEELWLMLAATTVLHGTAIHFLTVPEGRQAFYALSFLIGASLGLILIRILVFSFF